MITRPNHVSHYYLKKSQIGVISQAGNTNDGQNTGFGRDDRKRDRPPGDIAVGQKIVAQRALPFAKTQAEECDPSEIDRDDRKIELVEAHIFGKVLFFPNRHNVSAHAQQCRLMFDAGNTPQQPLALAGVTPQAVKVLCQPSGALDGRQFLQPEAGCTQFARKFIRAMKVCRRKVLRSVGKDRGAVRLEGHHPEWERSLPARRTRVKANPEGKQTG